MKPALQLSRIAIAFLLLVVLGGCGETPSTRDRGETPSRRDRDKPKDIPLRDWPDRRITGGDGEVANRQHLSIDKKVVDVWTTWGLTWDSSPVQIDIGLRDHTRDELKNWKVKITSPTLWRDFTTATVEITDALYAQHPDYKNGVVVFYEGREFNNATAPGEPRRGLNLGSHTITVEILDEQDRVKGLATLPMKVERPAIDPIILP